MKITYLLTTADLMGGTERAVFAQASALAEHHDVRVLSVLKSADASFFATEGFAVDYVVDATGENQVPVRANHGRSAAELARLASAPSSLIRPEWEAAFSALTDVELQVALAELDTDILVASTPPNLAIAAVLAPPRVIVVDQEHRPSAIRGADQEPLLIYGPQVDAIVSLTDRSTAWFHEVLGGRAPHLATVPNSIPTAFRPRSSLTNKVIVAAGRFTGQKHFSDLVAAFRTVVDAHPDWTLRIYGDGPLKPNLRRQIARHGLGDDVELPGPVADMTSEWSKGSIFAATSRSEGLPLVALEACAAGLPIVAYDCPTGPAEIIDGGRNGILVPMGDVEAMAEALIALIEDEDRRRKLGENAFRAAERYAPETVRDQWIDLFALLVRERDDDGAGSTRLSRAARRLATRAGSSGAAASSASPDAGDGGAVELPEPSARGGVTPASVRDENAADVLSALAEHDVPHFLVPGYRSTSTVVAVPATERVPAYRALQDAATTQGMLVSTVTGRGRVVGTRALPQLAELAPDSHRVLRVHRAITDPTHAVVLGPDVGCDIEFWDADPLDGARLVAPRNNRLIDAIDVDVMDELPRAEVGGVDAPSVAALAGTRWDEVDFPIDVVYTWVDGADEAWRRRRTEVAGEDLDDHHAEAVADQRFTNRDELMYSLRSIDQYAPWVRTIHIVTDRQTPEWLDTSHPRINVVDHSEIFADQGNLPTFNSHAIETQLHHIDGLSEHFLYFNDDVLLGRYVEPERFFLGNGTPKFFLSPVKLNFGGDAPPHLGAGRVNRELLRRDFGRTIAQSTLHVPYPMRRSVLEELEERYGDELAATAGSRFRAGTDVSLTSSLYPYYAFMTGRAVPARVDYSYVSLGSRGAPRRMTYLLRARNRDVISLGEPLVSEWTPQEQEQMARSFLGTYYPVPSQFEL